MWLSGRGSELNIILHDEYNTSRSREEIVMLRDSRLRANSAAASEYRVRKQDAFIGHPL